MFLDRFQGGDFVQIAYNARVEHFALWVSTHS